MAAGASPAIEDGLGKDAPAETLAKDATILPALPAAAPATARQPLQGRKKTDKER
jgi:hypothetical protein